MKALIIKQHWLDLILNGRKTWEIRGSNTHIRGRIALACSGYGQLWGEADLVDVVPVTTAEAIEANRDKHQIPASVLWNYPKPHAWVLANAVRYTVPKFYRHPQGAVIWVNL